MIERTLKQLLDLSAAGLTGDQLLFRLRSTGLRFDPAELLRSLDGLSERGEIRRDRFGRWQAVRRTEPRASPRGAPLVLEAVDAILRVRPAGPPAPDPEGNGDPATLPPWAALLGYYASALRRDPRGRIEEFPDRHGQAWQLLRPTGTWWKEAELTVPLETLPDTFREALIGGRCGAPRSAGRSRCSLRARLRPACRR